MESHQYQMKNFLVRDDALEPATFGLAGSFLGWCGWMDAIFSTSNIA